MALLTNADCTFYQGNLHQSVVYIPPQVNTEATLSDPCENYSQIGNPDAVLNVPGDFNQANLKKVMPDFHQHVDCATREKTLWITAIHHSKTAAELQPC